MKVALTVAQMLVRITGVLLLILGLLIWAEGMFNLINIHMLIGVVLVLSLWVLAVAAAQAGAPTGLAITTGVLGLVVLIFGMIQVSLLPGSLHWIIQVIHLLLGMSAIAMAEVLGGRLKRMQMAGAAA